MNERTIQLIIEAVNRSKQVLDRIVRQNKEASDKINRTWKDNNARLRTMFERFVDAQKRGWRNIVNFAKNAARDVRTSWNRAMAGLARSMERTIKRGLVGLGVGAIAAGARGIQLSFRQQVLEARFAATRPDPREQQRLRQFIRQQEGGIFTQQQLFAAVTEGRRIQDPRKLEQLIFALRGAAAAEGDLALAVVSVQRAMFEGEAELSERFGLLLREKNLTETSNRLFGKKVTALTDVQKAEVVYQEAIKQALVFQELEAKMLASNAGRFQLLKNRVNEFLLAFGESETVQKILTGLFNFLDKPLERLKTFGLDIAESFREMFLQIAEFVKKIFSDIIRFITAQINRLIAQLNRPIEFLNKNKDAVGGFFKNLKLPFGIGNAIGEAISKGNIPSIPSITGTRQKSAGFRDFGFADAFRGLVAPSGVAPSIPSPPRRLLAPGTIRTGRSFLMPSPRMLGPEGELPASPDFTPRLTTLTSRPRVRRFDRLQGLREAPGVGRMPQISKNEGAIRRLNFAQERQGQIAFQVADQIIGAWDQIGAATDSMTISVIAGFAQLVSQVVQMISQISGVGGFGGSGFFAGLASGNPVAILTAISAGSQGIGIIANAKNSGRRNVESNRTQTRVKRITRPQ